MGDSNDPGFGRYSISFTLFSDTFADRSPKNNSLPGVQGILDCISDKQTVMKLSFAKLDYELVKKTRDKTLTWKSLKREYASLRAMIMTVQKLKLMTGDEKKGSIEFTCSLVAEEPPKGVRKNSKDLGSVLIALEYDFDKRGAGNDIEKMSKLRHWLEKNFNRTLYLSKRADQAPFKVGEADTTQIIDIAGIFATAAAGAGKEKALRSGNVKRLFSIDEVRRVAEQKKVRGTLICHVAENSSAKVAENPEFKAFLDDQENIRNLPRFEVDESFSMSANVFGDGTRTSQQQRIRENLLLKVQNDIFSNLNKPFVPNVFKQTFPSNAASSEVSPSTVLTYIKNHHDPARDLFVRVVCKELDSIYNLTPGQNKQRELDAQRAAEKSQAQQDYAQNQAQSQASQGTANSAQSAANHINNMIRESSEYQDNSTVEVEGEQKGRR